MIFMNPEDMAARGLESEDARRHHEPLARADAERAALSGDLVSDRAQLHGHLLSRGQSARASGRPGPRELPAGVQVHRDHGRAIGRSERDERRPGPSNGDVHMTNVAEALRDAEIPGIQCSSSGVRVPSSAGTSCTRAAPHRAALRGRGRGDPGGTRCTTRCRTSVMMATPADLEDFAVGFTFSEQIVETVSDIGTVYVVQSDEGRRSSSRFPMQRPRDLRALARAAWGAPAAGCAACGRSATPCAPSSDRGARADRLPSDRARELGLHERATMES